RRHTRCYRDWSSDVCSSDWIEVAPIEAVRITRLGQELLRLRRIVGVRLEAQRELERARRHAARRARGAERLRLAEPPAVDGVVGGQAHAPVVPRRLPIPLIEEIQVVDADRAREAKAQRGSALQLAPGGRGGSGGEGDRANFGKGLE